MPDQVPTARSFEEQLGQGLHYYEMCYITPEYVFAADPSIRRRLQGQPEKKEDIAFDNAFLPAPAQRFVGERVLVENSTIADSPYQLITHLETPGTRLNTANRTLDCTHFISGRGIIEGCKLRTSGDWLIEYCNRRAHDGDHTYLLPYNVAALVFGPFFASIKLTGLPIDTSLNKLFGGDLVEVLYYSKADRKPYDISWTFRLDPESELKRFVFQTQFIQPVLDRGRPIKCVTRKQNIELQRAEGEGHLDIWRMGDASVSAYEPDSEKAKRLLAFELEALHQATAYQVGIPGQDS